MKSDLTGISRRAVVNRKIIMPDGSPRYLMERQVGRGQHVALWFAPRKAETKQPAWLAAELWQARHQLRRMVALHVAHVEKLTAEKE